MSNKTIGVDVDNTVCSVIDKWITFCCESDNYRNFDEWRYNLDLINNCVDYNITNYFDMKEGVDFLEFWKNENLYDDVECYPEAVDSIKALYYTGWKIIFISYCNDCNTHSKSKIDMLKRCFSFIHPDHFHFVQTKSKGVFKECLSFFADDRVSFVNQFKGKVPCYLIKTPYTQDEELLYDNVKEVNGWKEIVEDLL
ncbi:hypothetical protein [Vibrio phage S4-7]|nr:hypothetical protein [Vibrio phage S4-7]